MLFKAFNKIFMLPQQSALVEACSLSTSLGRCLIIMNATGAQVVWNTNVTLLLYKDESYTNVLIVLL